MEISFGETERRYYALKILKKKEEDCESERKEHNILDYFVCTTTSEHDI